MTARFRLGVSSENPRTGSPPRHAIARDIKGVEGNIIISNSISAVAILAKRTQQRIFVRLLAARQAQQGAERFGALVFLLRFAETMQAAADLQLFQLAQMSVQTR